VGSPPEGESEATRENPAELSEQEQAEVESLRKRDREVRTHEQAHVAAGGQFVRGGAQLEYETGPDGRRYAVGGEVSIETSMVSGDPQASVRKAQVVRRAALAPAHPSPTDRRAAAAASRMEAKARREMTEMRAEEMKMDAGEGDDVEATDGTGSSTATSTETSAVEAGRAEGAADGSKAVEAGALGADPLPRADGGTEASPGSAVAEPADLSGTAGESILEPGLARIPQPETEVEMTQEGPAGALSGAADPESGPMAEAGVTDISPTGGPQSVQLDTTGGGVGLALDVYG